MWDVRNWSFYCSHFYYIRILSHLLALQLRVSCRAQMLIRHSRRTLASSSVLQKSAGTDFLVRLVCLRYVTWRYPCFKNPCLFLDSIRNDHELAVLAFFWGSYNGTIIFCDDSRGVAGPVIKMEVGSSIVK